MKKLSYIVLTIVSSFLLSGCMFFSDGGDEESKNSKDTETIVEETRDGDTTLDDENSEDTEVEKEVENDTEPERDLAEENIAGLYAATICMVADPTFREGFMDGGNDREDGDDSENPFLGRYGYANDAEAEADLRMYINNDSFISLLSNHIASMCHGALGEKEFTEMITQLRLDYGGGEQLEKEVDVEGVCTWDEDCSSICEGTVSWERGCTASTDTCIKTFETDCSQKVAVVKFHDGETYEVPVSCVPGEGCVRDAIPIEQRKDELSQTRKSLNAKKQEMTSLYQQSAALCLGTLSDPTGITDVLASSLELDQTSEATRAVMQKISQAPETTPTARWCTLEQRLKDVDIPALEKELDVLLERAKNVDFYVDIIEK